VLVEERSGAGGRMGAMAVKNHRGAPTHY
jgi:tripartite-type tricarboxylate transporter receptor subunit TctC